jgi:galactose oxidase
MWSSDDVAGFEGDIGTAPSTTLTAFFDPSTGIAGPLMNSGVAADMFCPGIAYLPDGRLLINGGSSSSHTALYDPFSSTNGGWADAAPMNIARGYNSSVTLSNGDVFTIGGSWAGTVGPKDGELWSPGGGWQLTGISDNAIMGNDLVDQAQGFVEFSDDHAWLFAMPNGRVFQAGPSSQMNFFDPATGASTPAGTRGGDAFSINGTAVMYAPGKIFKAGGAPAYTGANDVLPGAVNATNAAYVIDITKDYTDPTAAPVVQQVAPINHARAYDNAVVLPDGEVFLVGGQSQPHQFFDDNSVLTPELWNPVTERSTDVAPMPTPRNYHSTALLLPDGRVFVGGGGQCSGCGDAVTPDPSANHPDFELYSPPYLFAADGSLAARPTITQAPAAMTLGDPLTVGVSGNVTSFSLVRLGTATHSVDSDQRRIPLTIAGESADGAQFTLNAPSDPGITVPGYYMLFAIDAKNVPSVSKIIKVSSPGLPGSPPPPPPPTSTPDIAVLDTTTGQSVLAAAQPYAGPVGGLQEQYINITSDSLNISVSTPNWFIHSGGGTDAIAANSGTNVLDGGFASNFMTDGSGTDTFFVDDRTPLADIWDTVAGFHAGDAATVWGITPQDFSLDWVDGQGAAGFTGLTLHATASGKPTASLTLAGFTQADLANGRLSVSFGTDPASGSTYMLIQGNS